jgi:hypothetical protein
LEGVRFDEMVVGFSFLAHEVTKDKILHTFEWKAFQPLRLTGSTFVSQISTFMSQTKLHADNWDV